MSSALNGNDPDPKYTVILVDDKKAYKLLRMDWMQPKYLLLDPFAQGVAEQLRSFGTYLARIDKEDAPLTRASTCTFINVCAMQGKDDQPPGSTCFWRCSSRVAESTARGAPAPSAPSRPSREAVMLAGDDGEFYVLEQQEWRVKDYEMPEGAGHEMIKRLIDSGCAIANIPPSIAVGCGEICIVVNLASIHKSSE